MHKIKRFPNRCHIRQPVPYWCPKWISCLRIDHCALWIDIPRILLFGYNPPPLLSPNARKLKLDDPRVVEKYCTYLHSSITEHNLFQQMDDLHRRTVYPLSAHLILEYEKLDRLVGPLMTEAEEQCQKLKAGSVPWTLAYLKGRR